MQSYCCAWVVEEEADESSIRRSKRTPVPKRGFKLIDDYDSKKEPPKKKIKTEEQKPEKINRGRKSNDKHNEKQEEEQIDEQKVQPEKAKRGRKSTEKAQEEKVSVKQGESSQELEEGQTILFVSVWIFHVGLFNYKLKSKIFRRVANVFNGFGKGDVSRFCFFSKKINL